MSFDKEYQEIKVILYKITEELLKGDVDESQEIENVLNKLIYSVLDEYRENFKKKNFLSIEDMKKADLKLGDIISTKGYYNENDNGEGKYEIVSYETFYEGLPSDLKAVAYRNDRWGLGNPYWSKTPVDGYGNHILLNGLVAKLVTESVVKVEQWGCCGDGIFDNTEPLIHLFAHTKKGYIQFRKNATYLMKSRPLNKMGLDIKNGTITNIVQNYNVYNSNEYIWLMCGYFTAGAAHGKPVMANIDGVTLDGNNATIKINSDDFCKGTNDFGVFEFGASIKNLEIKNFKFDGNGLSIITQGSRSTAHTLVYMPGEYKSENPGSAEGDLKTITGEIAPGKDTIREFSNINIHNNEFKNNGTGLDIKDGGGDFILIINPPQSNNVKITNNYFEDWGRWVFSVDLGGNGECFENYKFNGNTCIQTDNNKLATGSYRGLGWIDFEARKCWKNLEVKNNNVHGLNSFAINGNGKISENITISGNTIIRANRSYRSAYQYMFEFYSVEMKNLLVENNNIDTPGGSKFGYTLNNVIIRNNKFTTPIQIYGMYGDMIFEGNTRENKMALVQILSLTIPSYIKDNEVKYCNFEFINNVGGIEGSQGQQATIFDVINPNRYKYMKLKIEGNDSKLFNIAAWNTKDFIFDPTQVDRTSVAFSMRGAMFTNPTYSMPVNNPVLGGGIYNVGDIITTNLNVITRLESAFFYNKMNFKGFNAIRCTKKGYLPTMGSFLVARSDIKFTGNNKVDKYDHVYTDKELYIACNAGMLGVKLDHLEGKVLCGEVYMYHVANLAEIEPIKI